MDTAMKLLAIVEAKVDNPAVANTEVCACGRKKLQHLVPMSPWKGFVPISEEEDQAEQEEYEAEQEERRRERDFDRMMHGRSCGDWY